MDRNQAYIAYIDGEEIVSLDLRVINNEIEARVRTESYVNLYCVPLHRPREEYYGGAWILYEVEGKKRIRSTIVGLAPTKKAARKWVKKDPARREMLDESPLFVLGDPIRRPARADHLPWGDETPNDSLPDVIGSRP